MFIAALLARILHKGRRILLRKHMAIEIQILNPNSSAVTGLIRDLDNYLLHLYPLASNHLDSMAELSKLHVHFLGAFENDQPLGCGAVKLLPSGYGEIKRVYVSAGARGRGLGRKILTALEGIARNAGYTLLRLETGVYQPEALQLFEASGFIRIDRFGGYPNDPLSVFMEKRLNEL